ncbi:MAG TPA: UvrD-helicase domain-containing protein [Candidatus Fermentibacter daniensis]|nr:UvrD-helicase domain-containing protein [Candidatus Fermentibacter daniensis]HOR07761.1 UvrD-helicase domain-containing protein [Candidatus Fermentibacter daniensis]HPK52352.1 UvrD-helicase domain-containing protein [Candidatus Fermentibacter daniensis]
MPNPGRTDGGPADGTVRESIVSELARSVSVEASAGTGKTHLMTDRVMRLARHHGDISRIAVLTFGEAAAAELRRRIRARIMDMPRSGEEGALRRTLAGQLPGACITTIHSFAASMLREYSHIAGIDPSFEVEEQPVGLDELRRMWEEHLADDPGRLFECGRLIGLSGNELPEMALEVSSRPWFSSAGCLTEDGSSPVDWASARLNALEAILSGVPEGDRKGDAYRRVLAPARAFLAGLASEQELRETVDSIGHSGGSAKNWTTVSRSEATVLFKDTVAAVFSAPVSEQFARLVLPFAEKLRRLRADDLSTLSFDEILSRFRDSLEKSDDLRREIARRFRHILVDEFQDTSADQATIFRLIAGSGRGFRKGSVTIVGDPKQSIYAWRQADLELYGDVKKSLEDDREGTLAERITVSFRSSPAIIDLVNAAGPLIFDGRTAFDCGYSGFEPAPGAPAGPKPILVILDDIREGGGRPLPTGDAAAAAAYWCAEHLQSHTGLSTKAMEWAVLLKAGTHIDRLVETLSEAGIACSTTLGREFKARAEIADLAAIISCLLHPGDRRSLIRTLRSPHFGLDDATITTAVMEGLSDWSRPPGSLASSSPAAALACRQLEMLRKASRDLPVADFLQTLLSESAAVPVMAASGRDAIRGLSNLAFLVEQASGGAYPSLLDLLRALSEEAGRTELLEEPSPIAADGTVSVTSIHKSKGLTFENVILIPPLQYTKAGRGDTRLLVRERERRAALRFGRAGDGIRTPMWDALAEIQGRQTLAEARRLVYVALTRARTGLVTFVRRTAWEAAIDEPRFFDEVLTRALRGACEADPGLVEIQEIPCVPPGRGRSRRAGVMLQIPADRPLAALEPTLPLAPESEESARSRAVELGISVHRLLEKIDFADPAAWLCRARESARAGREDASKAFDLAGNLFSAPLPFDIRGARIAGREYPYLRRTPDGFRSRFVDLLAEHGGRLYAIDYKTDDIAAEEVEARAAFYTSKQEGYGQDLADSLGRAVSVWLVFLSPVRCHHVGDFGPGSRLS